MAITYDDHDRTRALADAVYVLIAETGLGALTLRRIGEQAGVSAGSILNHFGCKERAIAVCCSLLGRDHLRRLDERILQYGILGCAPTCANDVLDARVWLGVCELARSEERVAALVAESRVTRLDMISRALAHTASPAHLTALTSCFDGLDQAVAALEDPVPWEFAREAAATLLDRIAPGWRELAENRASYFQTWAAFSRSA